MWQCLPVKKDIVRIFPVSLLIALITASTAAHAQSNLGINTISSVREDRGRTAATISTVGRQPLPRPIIQFLPGENGTTIMVADFPDVVFPYPTKVIAVNAESIATSATAVSAPSRGIKLVRIGRFQESPPIFRVAIVSTDAEKLRSVRFNAKPGALSVHWSKSSAVSQQAMPPIAPIAQRPPARRRAYQTTFTPPPVAPPMGTMEPSMVDVPQVGQAYPTTIDPEIASAYLPLRPPIQQPSIKRGAETLGRTPVGLAAKAEKLHSKPGEAGKKAAKTVKPKSDPYRIATGSELAIATAPPLSKWKKGEQQASAGTTRLAYDASISSVRPTRMARSQNEKHESDGKQNVEHKQELVAPAQPTRLARVETPEQRPDIKSGDLGAKPIEIEKEDLQPSKKGLMSFYSKMKEKAQTLLLPEDTTTAQAASDEIKRDNNEVIIKSDSNATLTTAPVAEPAPTLIPEISLTQNGNNSGYTLKVVSPKDNDLNYSSFRLHNPERFVIDLDNMRGIQAAVVPQPENPEFLTAVRTGAPDPVKNTGRLVLDLSGESVSVIPSDSESVNILSFVIGKSDNPVAGIVPPPGSVLVLDAGHGGNDPGAQRGFVKEKDLTLAIAQKTRDKLVESGIKVIMTRDEDSFISLSDRVAVTNNLKPDLFLSVHINSLESTSDIHGIETYYQSDISRPLAQNIHESIVSELGAPDRAIRKAKFYVINRAQVPAVLAEVGFISNKSERDKLVSADYQEKIAGALAKGAILYLKQNSSVARKLSSAKAAEDTSKIEKVSGGSETEESLTSKEGPASNGKDTTTIKSEDSIPGASRLAQRGLGIKSH
ncbi:MAG: N-acetylmuramoyl-L-alanine amidase [Candidatus Obscuribacterales bacterium]|nr:N-acetylmuramoyl-L-alanine amidase [Candidatus Obscuribacterales bacterium]